MYVLIGTITHGIVEGSNHDVWTEVPVRWKPDGIELLGRVDAYHPQIRRVVDYKTTRYINQDKLPYGNHEDQLRTYAVMLRAMGLPVESAAVQYIDLTGPTRCRYCKTGQLVPAQEIFICDNCGREWERNATTHDGAAQYEVSLEGLDAWEEVLKHRMKTLSDALENDIPPVGEPSSLCAFCPFRKECEYVDGPVSRHLLQEAPLAPR